MANITLNWFTFNYGATEQRVYRDTATIDVSSPPAILATISGEVTTYSDSTIAIGVIYYYRVSILFGTDEYFSDEIIVDSAFSRDVLDAVDMSAPIADIIADIDSNEGLEVVVSFKEGNVAEDTTLKTIIDAYGQHKWPQINNKVRRMWILSRNSTTGEVLRVYAERQSNSVDPDTIIYDSNAWKWEVLWDGVLTLGQSTWYLTNGNDVGDSFSASTLSADDGSWLFAEGIDTQGNQTKPEGIDLWGVANWNYSDSSAKMYVKRTEQATFTGVVVFAL